MQLWENTDYGYIIKILNTKSHTSARQHIDQIQRPDIIENHECRQCKNRAINPDTATINMVENDILLQYAGGRDEAYWGPPELPKQQIIQTHDVERYELPSEISYAERHYIQQKLHAEILHKMRKSRRDKKTT